MSSLSSASQFPKQTSWKPLSPSPNVKLKGRGREKGEVLQETRNPLVFGLFITNQGVGALLLQILPSNLVCCHRASLMTHHQANYTHSLSACPSCQNKNGEKLVREQSTARRYHGSELAQERDICLCRGSVINETSGRGECIGSILQSFQGTDSVLYSHVAAVTKRFSEQTNIDYVSLSLILTRLLISLFPQRRKERKKKY